MTAPLRVVLDTNVLDAATRSRRGASFRLLELVGKGPFELVVSVPLVLEYEAILTEHRQETGLTETDVDDLLDYVCAVARHQEIFFLWRPYLRDPKDDLVLEAAVAGGCRGIVSFNKRDFVGSERSGLWVLTPGEFLADLRGVK
jgi:predicted nucleic acid-binding protein